MNARLCKNCGNAWAIDRTNDWIVATQVVRLDNPVPRVDNENVPVEAEVCSWDCLIGWAQAHKAQNSGEPAQPQAVAVES